MTDTSPGKFQQSTRGTGCENCEACTAGRYLREGCNGVSYGICASCTVCPQDTIRPCTPWEDAVCGSTTQCDARPTPSVFPWIKSVEKCQVGGYLSSFFTGNRSRQCLPCPAGLAGLNGVFCERCGPLEEPYYLDRSSCVCKEPATMNATGGCVCPDGFEQAGDACAPCGEANTYGVGGACRSCPAGTYSARYAATACTSCEYGKYRLSGQAGPCQACPLEGWFAPDAELAVCVQCNFTCAQEGWQWDSECPGDTTGRYSVCKECFGGLPDNAVWGNTTECVYDCLPGFYRIAFGCAPCTQRVCEAGFRFAQCTETSDSHCDNACEDARKPAFHSHWEVGENCPWDCDDGYEIRSWNYVAFRLWECVLVA